MENKKKECFKCQHFDKYYTRGIKQFNPTKCGWCCKLLSQKNLHDGCEFFRIKTREPIYKSSVRLILNNLLMEITELHNVIMQEREEYKEINDAE